MILDQFITKWLGKKADWDGHFQGQCVDLFRYYVEEVLGFPQPKGVAGAKDFWTNYESDPNLKNYYDKIPNTPTGVPEKGDVMLWNEKSGGGFGHVSIFIEGTATKFISFDQNWPTLSVCTKTSHTYTNVLGWLRPKLPQSNQEQLDALRKERDSNWNLYQETKILLEQSEATVKAFTDFRQTLAQKLDTDDQTTSIIGAVERYLFLEDQVRSLQSKYDEAVRENELSETKVKELEVRLSELQEQIKAFERLHEANNELQKALDTCAYDLSIANEKKLIDKLTTGDLLKELLSRLARR